MIRLDDNIGMLETSPAFEPFSRVTLIVGTDENGDEVSYTAGDDTGRELTAKCPWATQAIANNLLAELVGYVYQPFTAGDALLDPSAELGDVVLVGDITSQLGSIATTFDALYTADIAAPQDEEIDHEYPYEPQPERTAARKAATVTAELSVLADTISSKISSAEAQTLITQNLNSITLSASAGSNQSTVTISANGIVVDSAVVRFTNIVADSIVANARITAPVISGGTINGVTLKSSTTTQGIEYGAEIVDGNIDFFYGDTDYGEIGVGSALGETVFRTFNSIALRLTASGFLKLESGKGGSAYSTGLILDSSMYGTLAQRPAARTAGRIFFVRA